MSKRPLAVSLIALSAWATVSLAENHSTLHPPALTPQVSVGDEGDTWFTLPGVTGYWGVAFGSPKAGWLVGTGGRILRIRF